MKEKRDRWHEAILFSTYRKLLPGAVRYLGVLPSHCFNESMKGAIGKPKNNEEQLTVDFSPVPD